MFNPNMKHILNAFFSIFLIINTNISFAQNTIVDQQIKPYLQVKTVVGDERVVRAYFSPNCQFSKMYFQFFKNLSSTLPENKTFYFTPLINIGDGVSYSAAFFAVQRYYPAYIPNFVEASLVGVQDKGISTLSWGGINRIGRAAHVPVPISKLASLHEKEISADLKKYSAIQKQLEITNTPAVAVAGTYIVTPEFTQGDAAMFSQLVNGLISMAR